MTFLICLATFCFMCFPFVCALPVRPYYQHSVKFLDEIPDDHENYRLPKSLKPTNYDIKIIPHLDNGTFKGWATITFDVLSNTNLVVLNLNNDSIPSKSIEASISSSDPALISNWWVNTTYQTITFQLNTTLSIQKGVTITISYGGVLSTDMTGFYLSTFNINSIIHTIAITQFESTSAREAFPCFDEPAFRAKFTMTLCRKTYQNSISNMPLYSSQQDSVAGMVCDTYYETPPMPTYLVAFGVFDLEHSGNDTYRVYSRPDVLNDTMYAFSIGPSILTEIGNILGINYSLPKMDVVAVPDFNAGAMENWGLTTFREKYVLYNPMKNSWMDKYLVHSVIAHEFGHQWFGDLVTPQWWDYAWLNEAFATYFEYTIPNMEPKLDIGETMFVTQAVQPALAMDTGSPRPMTAPVYTPSQIEEVFDYVIYEKGGSVLRMTKHFLTEYVFWKGLHDYLITNKYGTGSPMKLFSALENAAKAANVSLPNITEVLQDWTTQPGYPLITVNTSFETSENSTTYDITQTPYGSSTNCTWRVPLSYTTEEELEFDPDKASTHWLIPSDSNTSKITVKGRGWTIFNIQQKGFYRVNYDESNWDKISEQLKCNHKKISIITRAQLLDDAFHLASTGHMSYNQAFKLTTFLPNETNYAAFNSFFKNMRRLINSFYGTNTGNALKQYSQNIMQVPFNNIASNISMITSTFEGSITVMNAVQFSCFIELPDCLQLAKKIFKDQIKNIMAIPAEVKETVICTGLQSYSSKDALNDILDYFMQSNNGAEELTLLKALGCVNSADVAKTYLDFVCNSTANNIRLQDRWIAYKSLISQQTGIPYGVQYMVENFPKVKDCLGPRLQSVVSTLAATISQDDHISKVKSIISDTRVDQQLRELLNSTVLPAVTKHQTWLMSRQVSELKAWTEAFNNSASSTISHITLTVCISLFILITSN